MLEWMQRNLSMDDLWSFLGYLLLMALNAVVSETFPLATVSVIASGMVTIMWVVNPSIRSRTPHPNARVAFWASVAGVSAIVAAM